MYTLVVVDMQYDFKAALHDNVQNHCIAAIKKAKQDRAPIVFLEYFDQGKTIEALATHTRAYSRAYHISKYKLASKRFKVCGVYTEHCVHDTVRGLTQLAPTAKIELISNACWSTDQKDHDRGINKMSKLKNVKTV